MLNILSPVFVSVLALLSAAEAAPRNKGQSSSSSSASKQQTLQAQAAAIPQGISQATDGSTILDTNATVK